MSTALLIPPMNFGMVDKDIYRSGYIRDQNFSFLNSLKLTTVINLSKDGYPPGVLHYLESKGVNTLDFSVDGNKMKKPFTEIPHRVLYKALLAIMDKRNHPVLIHCNKGKHRTVGVYRKYKGWSITSIFEEYTRFASSKARTLDQQYIELFKVPPLLTQEQIEELIESSCE